MKLRYQFEKIHTYPQGWIKLWAMGKNDDAGPYLVWIMANRNLLHRADARRLLRMELHDLAQRWCDKHGAKL